ncbi:MAG: hypothetical protein Q9208_006267 [Pyrenodesmia sp. 3 TL-2023]
MSELDEIWYDYVSVHRWTDNIKGRILLAIPDIYGSANMAIIYFKDLRQDMVLSLYDGQTTDERLKAVSGICNLNWFTRVWTATEYIRSSQVMSMDGEGNVCSKWKDPIFLRKMLQVWFEEAQKHKSIHHLETRAGIGKDLVPWNLGPLLDMGKAKSSVFGLAFGLLSKRRCRSNYGFLHALLGLVEPTSDRPLDHEFEHNYKRIARLCLAVGDYSPLLMTPRLEKHNMPQQWEIKQGLNDVGVWPLGAQRQLPYYHQDFSFRNGDLETGDPVLKLQLIGVVSQAHGRLEADPIVEFAHEASIVLDATGPDLDSFIDTLGCRLYDERFDFIKQKLAAANQSAQLAGVLQERCNKELGNSWLIEGPGGARWVAEIMTLSLTNPGRKRGEPVSRMAFIGAHGDTIHAGPTGGNHLVSISCTACHRLFVFRAGLFEPSSDVVGSIA